LGWVRVVWVVVHCFIFWFDDLCVAEWVVFWYVELLRVVMVRVCWVDDLWNHIAGVLDDYVVVFVNLFAVDVFFVV